MRGFLIGESPLLVLVLFCSFFFVFVAQAGQPAGTSLFFLPNVMAATHHMTQSFDDKLTDKPSHEKLIQNKSSHDLVTRDPSSRHSTKGSRKEKKSKGHRKREIRDREGKGSEEESHKDHEEKRNDSHSHEVSNGISDLEIDSDEDEHEEIAGMDLLLLSKSPNLDDKESADGHEEPQTGREMELLLASMRGDEPKVRELLEEGQVNVNYTNRHHESAIYLAARRFDSISSLFFLFPKP